MAAKEQEKIPYPLLGPSYYYAFGEGRRFPHKIGPEWIKPPNYSEPGKPRWVDIFKGKDDENIIFKTKQMMRFALYATGTMAIYDITIGTQPKDVTGMVRRVGYWGIPFFAGGFAYLGTVAIASSLRGKSDHKNHVLGGYAFGAISGACRKSPHFGFWIGTAAAITGVLYKDSVLYDYEVIGKFRPKMHGSTFSHKRDWTMPWFRDRGRGDWVRSEEERKCYRTFFEDVEIWEPEVTT